MTNFGESVFGVRGLKSKIEEQCSVEGFMDNWRPKHGSIPSINKKKQFEVWDKQADRRTDGQTDRQVYRLQTESTTKNNKLLARRGDQYDRSRENCNLCCPPHYWHRLQHLNT